MIGSSQWLLDDRVQDLLAEWTERRETGEDISIEELCGDDPDLAERLAAAIEELSRTDWLFSVQGDDQDTVSPAGTGVDSDIADDPASGHSQKISATALFERLQAFEIIDEESLSEIRGNSSDDDGRTAANRLLKSGLLTPFQLHRIYANRAAELRIGDCVLLEPIGEGGMGRVYKALQRSMDRVVAIKILRSRVFGKQQSVERFRREVRSVALLNHANIVTAYDSGQDDGRHYLVMEYFDGRDLWTRIQREGPFDVSQAVRITIQVATALDYAHQQGVVHRDVKPANLLLDSAGNVKLLDLGLARPEFRSDINAADGLTASGQIMGSVDYISPEQAVDSRRADERSDVYSLGCTLYTLLQGRAMFERESVVNRILAHQSGTIPSLCAGSDEIPESLNGVFLKMVAKRPADRFATMADVITALETIERELGTAVEAIQPQAVWHRWLWAFAAMFVLAVGLAYAYFPKADSPREEAKTNGESKSESVNTANLKSRQSTGSTAKQIASRKVKQPLPRSLLKYSKRIATNPRDMEAYWLRARGLIYLNHFRDAESDCTAALRLDPQNQDAMYWRGLARMNLK